MLASVKSQSMSTPKLGTDDAWWGAGSRYDATKRAIESIGLEERWCEVLKVAGYDDLDLAKLGSMDSVQLGTLGQRLGMDDASSVAFASRFGDAARVEALKMVEAIGGDKASLDEKVERLKQQAEEEEALIRKAAAMLNNPRVVDTTVEQRIDFLRSKGLTASQERSSHAHEHPATQQRTPRADAPPETASPLALAQISRALERAGLDLAEMEPLAAAVGMAARGP